MKLEKVIKENIKVEIEIFKVFVAVVILLTGAVYGLMVQLYNDPVKKILCKDPFNLILFAVGLIFLLTFVFGAISRYIAIRKLLKKLKQK